MGWFDEQGFTERPPGQEGNRGGGAPENYAYGGEPSPTMQPATPGMTDVEAQYSNPNNPRVSTSSGGSQGGGYEPFDENAFFDMMQGYPPTNDGMRAFYAAAQQRWGAENVPELLEHPNRLDKFRFRDGRTFDVIGGAGGPNPSWVRNLEGGHGGGPTGNLGAMAGGNWQAGMDPSYEFRFKEGQKALERSAASRGTLLTGGTLKALASFGQGLASTEFGNIFNRNYQLAGLGLDAAGQAAGAGTSYNNAIGSMAGNQASDTANLITGAGNAQAAGTVGAGNAWSNTIGNLGNIGGEWAAGYDYGTLGRAGRGGGSRRYPWDERVGPGSGGGPGWYGGSQGSAIDNQIWGWDYPGTVQENKP